MGVGKLKKWTIAKRFCSEQRAMISGERAMKCKINEHVNEIYCNTNVVFILIVLV
jgi:hypothetical protein